MTLCFVLIWFTLYNYVTGAKCEMKTKKSPPILCELDSIKLQTKLFQFMFKTSPLNSILTDLIYRKKRRVLFYWHYIMAGFILWLYGITFQISVQNLLPDSE
jgi:hypothetical protein